MEGRAVAKRTRKTKSRAAKTASRQAWTKEQVADLRRHSKAKTRVMRLEKIFKRSSGTLRQKARTLGLSLGHTKRRKKR
jgi:hypothetical protein